MKRDEHATAIAQRRHEIGQRVLDALFGWAPMYAVDPRATHEHAAGPSLRDVRAYARWASRRSGKRKRRLEQKHARRKNRRR